MLYFRQLLTMLVSLYTVRVILDALGTIDYGIYNVVGGIVTMFSFLSATMASASQRFFAFELGKKNYEQLKKTFSITVLIYFIIALIILVLAETVGLWFLNHKMVIPSNRIEAANWIYQFSILSFMATMFAIPYNAVIIAYERMNIYAYVSILEVTLKLVSVYLLSVFFFDKLKLYAIFMFIVTAIVTFIYRQYCKRKIPESGFVFFWDVKLFKEIVNYSLWNLFGTIASILKDQGINLLLNIFFNPIVNAARAIAFQISSSINQFITNFAMAINPQIIKHYAANEKRQMLNLVFTSSKFSFLLMFIVSMPMLLETDYILSIWLKTVPPYLVLFTRLVIISTLIDSLSTPLVTAALATGLIQKYQLVVGGILMLNLPVSYILLKLGLGAEYTMYVSIGFSLISLVARLFMLARMLQLDVKKYLTQVFCRVLIVSIIAYIIPLYLNNEFEIGFVRLFFVTSAGFLTSAVSIYFVGFSFADRTLFMQIINSKILRKTN